MHKSFSDVFFKCRRRLACLWDDKMSRSSFRIWTSWILPPHPHIWKKKEVYFHDLLLSARLFNIRISAVDFSCLLRSISLVTRSGWAWHPDDLLNVTQWPDDDLLITVSHPWVRPPPSPEGPNGASRSQFHDLLDGFLLKSEQEHVIAGTEASRCSATSCRNSSGEQKLPGD